MSSSKITVIVAGQIPPPFGGQNIMVQKAITQFARIPTCETIHLPFYFTPDVREARAGTLPKLIELFRVIVRLLRIRQKRPIDLLIYPTGGPQSVPMIRDLLLLPWIFLCSRRVILHFHAAGIADRFESNTGSLLVRSLRWLYGKAFAAVVMTKFNRRDPESAGIKRVLVIPHRLPDEFDPSLVQRADPAAIQLLYVGHLCADKGTPQLLEAFASVRGKYPNLRLELVGECLPPFSASELACLLDRLHIRAYVSLPGVLTGRAKSEAFGRADLFVFPSVAPYESFGLVLVEAMEWCLPIVATDWRGNAEVLTSDVGAVCFKLSPAYLSRDIASALEQALSQRIEWEEWGKKKRHIFEQTYREHPEAKWLAEPIISLLT